MRVASTHGQCEPATRTRGAVQIALRTSDRGGRRSSVPALAAWAGFTLMETLISVMILTGAMIVIGSAWSGNIARIEKARVNATIAALLERKLTELELEYRGRPLAEWKEEDAGDFSQVAGSGGTGQDLRSFRWEMTSKEFEVPDLTSLNPQNQDNVGLGQNDQMAGLIMRTVSEYIKQVVREVTVTVVYQPRKKSARELRQSVSTYFVDYSRPISVPGLGGAASALGGAGGGAQAPSGTSSPGATGSGSGQ